MAVSSEEARGMSFKDFETEDASVEPKSKGMTLRDFDTPEEKATRLADEEFEEALQEQQAAAERSKISTRKRKTRTKKKAATPPTEQRMTRARKILNARIQGIELLFEMFEQYSVSLYASEDVPWDELMMRAAAILREADEARINKALIKVLQGAASSASPMAPDI